MLSALGRAVTRRPWMFVAGWLVATVVLAVLAALGGGDTREGGGLPDGYESVRAARLEPGTEAPQVLLVFTRADGRPLTEADTAEAARVTREVLAASADGSAGNSDGGSPGSPAPSGSGAEPPSGEPPEGGPDSAVSPEGGPGVVLSPDKRVGLAPLPGDPDVTLPAAHAAQRQPYSGLHVGVTGPAALAADLDDAGGTTDMLVMLATLALIVLLGLTVFRSPVAALLPIVVVALAAVISVSLLTLFGLRADGSVASLLIIVLFGIGTDYVLFVLFRYRQAGDAVGRGPVIASAGAVVAGAFLALVPADTPGMRDTGLSLALAVTVTALAGLTLAPAVVSIMGRRVFWPSRRQAGPEGARPSRWPDRLPRAAAPLAAAALIALSAGVLTFEPDVAGTGALPKGAPSVAALEDLRRGFPAGATSPTRVYLVGTADAALVDQYGRRLAQVPGVAQVQPQPASSGSGGFTRFDVVLTHEPTSPEAIDLVGGELLRVAHDAAPAGTRALVGGETMALADMKAAVSRDYRIVFPLASLLILAVLVALLRRLLLPLALLAAVALGYLATLGATSLVFTEPLTAMMPLILYVFVVAVGTDYTILVVKSEGGASEAAPAVVSAGVILAGSFAVLMLSPTPMMRHLGFALACGIAIAAFVTALVITPALARRAPHPARPAQAAEVGTA
ncbi:MMPL family transporter [Thermoactinospora rubra]|uniref:MMPL family transporter n=1 Tax=Thermoactinospora rubra TaxID=1088767 RepID=UPI000A116D1C|nr:MMPL family transporter [Thermoactinospora rubra]